MNKNIKTLYLMLLFNITSMLLIAVGYFFQIFELFLVGSCIGVASIAVLYFNIKEIEKGKKV